MLIPQKNKKRGSQIKILIDYLKKSRRSRLMNKINKSYLEPITHAIKNMKRNKIYI